MSERAGSNRAPWHPGAAGRIVVALAFVAIGMAGTQPAAAQDVRPGDERLELPSFESEDERVEPPTAEPLPPVPDFEPAPREPGRALPPLPLPATADTSGVARGRRVAVEKIVVVGNSVLDPAELDAVTAPYEGRELGYEELQELRDAVTLRYVEAGYATSGALIPSQSLADGVLELQIVEGRLGEIEVRVEGRLRPRYVESRLARFTDDVVNVRALERQLQLLQQDPRIRRVRSALLATETRGLSRLEVVVTEANPWIARLAGSNYNSPAIGEGRATVAGGHRNVTGFGDSASFEWQAGEGLQDIRGSWAVPITRYDTTLEAYFRRSWTDITESPLDAFDIESRLETYGFGIEQPVWRTLNLRLDAFLRAEWRRSRTYLANMGFSFVPGPENGRSRIAVLRPGFRLTWRTPRQVVAFRSQFSVGLDILNATDNSGDVPDGRYFTWLGQVQAARRLRFLDMEVVARGDVQLADRPLLSLEQFSVGGRNTVRGFRENQLVRDNGVVGSIEFRLPLPMPRLGEWRPRFEVAPFVDAGYSFNTDRGERGPTTLVSAGVGARIALRGALFQLYWGRDLRDLSLPGDGSLQDDGIHVGFTWQW